jgi:hypothetical protein
MATDDMEDHYTASYGFTKMSYTWCQTLFFQVLDVPIVNSLHSNKLLTHLNLKRNLAEQLGSDVRNISSRKHRQTLPLLMTRNMCARRGILYTSLMEKKIVFFCAFSLKIISTPEDRIMSD